MRRLVIAFLLGSVFTFFTGAAFSEERVANMYVGCGLGKAATNYSGFTKELIEGVGSGNTNIVTPNCQLLLDTNEEAKKVYGLSIEGISEKIHGTFGNVRIDENIFLLERGNYFGNKLSSGMHYTVAAGISLNSTYVDNQDSKTDFGVGAKLNVGYLLNIASFWNLSTSLSYLGSYTSRSSARIARIQFTILYGS